MSEHEQNREAVGPRLDRGVGRPAPRRLTAGEHEVMRTALAKAAPVVAKGRIAQAREPAWAQQCRECANLRQQHRGRIWKCMALRIGHAPGWPAMGYCADARAPGGVCGPEGRAFVKTPNVL